MTRALLIAALLAACTGDSSPTEPGGPGSVLLDLTLATEHFVLRYTASDAGKMETYAAALEESHPRITADLGQSGLPPITGNFFPDRASYSAATGYDATGSVRGPNTFDVVAAPLDPSLPVHEFAHCVTLHLDGRASNNPTWLWEAVAVFEAGQFVHPQTVTCLATGQFPSLAQLNRRGGDCDIYRVGYTIAEYVVDGWGISALRDLIQAYGDTEAALGIATGHFEAGWQHFVEQRYL